MYRHREKHHDTTSRRRTFGRPAVVAAALAAVSVLAVPSALAAGPAGAAGRGGTALVADPTSYVNTMIGTQKGVDWENTFPGVTAPFGMMQFSPDTGSGPTGYAYTDTTIKGSSLDHFSGGCSSFGDIPILPVTGEVGADPAARTEHFSHDEEHAAPGSYGVRLSDSDVQVDIGATARTGLASFGYPAGSQAQLLVKSGTSLGGDLAAEVHVVGDREISGTTTPHGLCNNSKYTMYFDITFDRPFTAHGTWQPGSAGSGGGTAVTPGSSSATGAGSGAYLTFDTSADRSVTAKIGMSYVSTSGAAANAKAEIPGLEQARPGADQDRLAGRAAQGVGRRCVRRRTDHVLHVVVPLAAITRRLQRRGRPLHRLRRRDPPGAARAHAVRAFSDWDIYRSLAPLQTMLYPDKAGDMANSLLRDAQQQGGWWPKWPSQNMTGNVMNGDNGVPLFAQYVAFGATGVNIADALPIMKKGATRSQKVGWGWVERPASRTTYGSATRPTTAPRKATTVCRAPRRPWSGPPTTSRSHSWRPGSATAGPRPSTRCAATTGRTSSTPPPATCGRATTAAPSPRDPASRPRRPARSGRTATTRATRHSTTGRCSRTSRAWSPRWAAAAR